MTDIYAKFYDACSIVKAPYSKGSIITNYHLMPELLKADGYQKLRPIPPKPNDSKEYMLNYRQVDNEIEPFWRELYQPELTYYEQRAQSYPSSADYLDAQVKINSGNPELAAEGQQQLSEYYSQCLAVKEMYPKPQAADSGEGGGQ